MGGRLVHVALAATVAVAAAAACSSGPHATEGRPPGASKTFVASNATRGDYAGSESCKPCHAAIYEAWSRSPMHRMTRSAEIEAPAAPFGGESFEVGTDRATMETHGSRRYFRVSRVSEPDALYLVTKIIGGRYREDYAGVPVDSTDVAPPMPPRAGEERVLPGSWLLFERAWRYKGYSVMVKERRGLRATPHASAEGDEDRSLGTGNGSEARWSRTCIGCHNTLPALTMLYDDLGARGEAYQGKVSDTLLPKSRAWTFEVAAPSALEGALRDELARLGGDAKGTPGDVRALLDRAASSTLESFSTSDLVEQGVGCEACHNGSRAHVQDPSRLPTFALASDAFRVSTGSDAPASAAQTQNRVCARCHTVLFSRYEPTWEGGKRSQNPGGSTINSGEARDFLLGGCASKMTCTTCHDPHGQDDRAALEKLGTPAGNGVCTGCHTTYASAGAASSHSKHREGSAGTSCVACHMPKKNMGLAYELTRYHRIGSPTDTARVTGDRPLECALCHTDVSVETILGWMDRDFGKKFDRGALERIYGKNLSMNVLDATFERGKPHEVVVAASTIAKARKKGAVEKLRWLLDHEYPLVRFWARYALDAISGERE